MLGAAKDVIIAPPHARSTGGYLFQTHTQVQKTIDLAAGIDFLSLFFTSASQPLGLKQWLEFSPACVRCSHPLRNPRFPIMGYVSCRAARGWPSGQQSGCPD